MVDFILFLTWGLAGPITLSGKGNNVPKISYFLLWFGLMIILLKNIVTG